jgi:hypothetical protein
MEILYSKEKIINTNTIPTIINTSKNSLIAKNGFKAEEKICSQENIKQSLELYFKLAL